MAATDWARIQLLEARLRWWRSKHTHRARELAKWKVTGDRAHYWLEQNEKVHSQKGIELNRRQIEEIRPHIAKWKKLTEEATAEIRKYADAIHKLKPKPPPAPSGEGYSVPATSWNPYRRKLANWIIREITDAVNRHGARGYVTSGVRTYAEQKVLYERYLRGGNIAAPPGLSNHEGWDYTRARGAVDWSDPESLNRALVNKQGHKLLWAETHGLSDWPHFSATGH